MRQRRQAKINIHCGCWLSKQPERAVATNDQFGTLRNFAGSRQVNQSKRQSNSPLHVSPSQLFVLIVIGASGQN